MDTKPSGSSGPLHVEAKPVPSQASGNPLSGSLNVVVSLPEEISIKMVNASTLSDYEMWVFLCSVLSNAVVGFIVATIQAFDAKASNSTQLLMTTIVFAILFLATGGMAISKRHSLTSSGKNIKLKASEATAE